MNAEVLKNLVEKIDLIRKSYSGSFLLWLSVVLLGEILITGILSLYLYKTWDTTLSIVFLGILIFTVVFGIAFLRDKRREFERSNSSYLGDILTEIDVIRGIEKDKLILQNLEKFDLSRFNDADNKAVIDSLINSLENPESKEIAVVILRKGGYVNINYNYD
jgi:hypothetical protein